MKTHKEMFESLLNGHSLQAVSAPRHKLFLRDDGMLATEGGAWTYINEALTTLNPRHWEIDCND